MISPVAGLPSGVQVLRHSAKSITESFKGAVQLEMLVQDAKGAPGEIFSSKKSICRIEMPIMLFVFSFQLSGVDCIPVVDMLNPAQSLTT